MPSSSPTPGRDRVRAFVASWSEARLPSIRELARDLGLSPVTVHRALAELEREKVLVVKARSGIFLRGLLRNAPTPKSSRGSGPENPSAPLPGQAASRLAALLEEGIRTGQFLHSQPLPKIRALATSFRASDHTVREALRLLMERGLLQKRGRGFVVQLQRPGEGPSGDKDGSFSGELAGRLQNAPVILILLAKENSWRKLCVQERTMRFCLQFLTESERHGVRVQSVLADPHAIYTGSIVSGRNAIRALIEGLGSRYLGTLVPLSRAELAAFEDWASWLNRFGKPVVWFDRYGESAPSGARAGGPAGPGEAEASSGSGRKPAPGLLACRFDEERAVALAAEILQALGHRVIALPHSNPEDTWAESRIRLFEKAMGASPPDRNLHDTEGAMRLLRSEKPPYHFWRAHDPRDLFSRWKERGLPHLRRLLARPEGFDLFEQKSAVIRQTPFLAPFFRDHRPTALLAPNDLRAREYYFWLSAAGIEVPRDLSLLSFDNSSEVSPLPISSIDFGFGHLGFEVFHLFLGALPRLQGRRGHLAARPFLADRGSLAPPGRKVRFPDMKGLIA